MTDPVVLIHGFGCTPAVWEPLANRLAGSHDLLPVALDGHTGGTAIPVEARVSVAMLVEGAERDMDAAGIRTAHLVGNSLGGWIALELARRGRATTVIALAPGGGWEPGSRDERRLRRISAVTHRLGATALPHIKPILARPRLRRMLLRAVIVRGDRLPPSTALQLITDAVNCPAGVDLMTAIFTDGPPRTLDGITCPVLIAWGSLDRVIPARRYASRLRELVPTAEWVELLGVGHMPMIDDPELVARTITQFLQAGPRRTSSGIASAIA